jgi:hypothetical protein
MMIVFWGVNQIVKIEDVIRSITNPNARRYIKFCIKQLSKYSIPLYLDGGLSVIGANTAGYFAEDEGVRCFVGPSLDWLLVLGHEKNHALSFALQKPQWIAYQQLDTSIDDIIHRGKQVINPIKTCRVLVNLEHQAETAAIRDAKKYYLPVDLPYYQQVANLTLWKYIFCIHNNGYWVKLTNKVQNDLAATMPTKLLPRNTFLLSNMPPELRNQLEELRIK